MVAGLGIEPSVLWVMGPARRLFSIPAQKVSICNERVVRKTENAQDGTRTRTLKAPNPKFGVSTVPPLALTSSTSPRSKQIFFPSFFHCPGNYQPSLVWHVLSGVVAANACWNNIALNVSYVIINTI